MIELVSIYLASYLCLVFHELGHFAAARHLKAHVESVNFGHGKPFYTYFYDSIPFNFSLLPISGLVRVFANWNLGQDEDSDADKRKTILLYSAGIMANLLLCALSFPLLWLSLTLGFVPTFVSNLLFNIAMINLLSAIGNAIPHTFFGQVSDGKVIYDTIKSRKR